MSAEDAYWQAYIDQMIEVMEDDSIPDFPILNPGAASKKSTTPKAKAPIAEQAVRLVEEFEKSGRKVKSLTIKGEEIKLEI